MMGRVDSVLATSSPDLTRLSQLRCSLEEKLDTLKLLDAEILELVEDDEEALAGEIEQADEFKGDIYSAIIKAKKKDLSTTPNPGHPPADNGEPPENLGAVAYAKTNSVKLPKLTLRSFSGDITQWLTFWDLYQSAIHTNDQLSDIDKFNYLKSLLNHTALEAISGLTLTSPNYAEAISILEKRFGNRQQIIAKHMDLLLNAEPVTSTNNLKGLRHLFDFVETHIRSLKSLGVCAGSYGSLLSSVLLNKLPSDVRLIISRGVSEEHWSLDALMKVLEEELRARERAVVDKPSSNGGSWKSKHQTPPTAAALVSGTGHVGPVCCYCQQEHLSKDCKIVTQVEARKQILRKSGRCFVCLRRGHLGRECHSRTRCNKCNGRHHTSICQRENSGQPQGAEPSKTRLNASQQDSHKQEAGPIKTGLNVNAPSFPAPTTTSLYVTTNKTVLLQTAQASVRNPRQPTIRLKVRAIFDTGSQRSYITNQAARALSLEPEDKQQMSIFTFGSEKKSLHSCELVEVLMKTTDAEIELQLLTVPIICEPLASQPITLCIDS